MCASYGAYQIVIESDAGRDAVALPLERRRWIVIAGALPPGVCRSSAAIRTLSRPRRCGEFGAARSAASDARARAKNRLRRRDIALPEPAKLMHRSS